MRKEKGFTLIEVLVVVSILGVLMGLISVLVIRSSATQREQTTRMALQTLGLKIDMYTKEFKRLPGMTVKELATASERWKGLSMPENFTNECNEVLLVALRHPDFSQRLGDNDFNVEEPFGNTDQDSWNQVPYGSSGADALEILDAYGSPVVYISKNMYGEPVTIVNHLGDEVEVVALKKSDGTYYNPTGYQLISVGENGVQDLEALEGGDDIMNFKLEEE